MPPYPVPLAAYALFRRYQTLLVGGWWPEDKVGEETKDLIHYLPHLSQMASDKIKELLEDFPYIRLPLEKCVFLK